VAASGRWPHFRCRVKRDTDCVPASWSRLHTAADKSFNISQGKVIVRGQDSRDELEEKPLESLDPLHSEQPKALVRLRLTRI
jgi:hypothetical protein